MPFGRGGAGNIQAAESASAQASTDLEAGRTPADSHANDVVPSDYKREEQQYAHTGRGGAGNYYSPKELKETGRFEGAGTSHILGDGTPAPKGEERREPTRAVGRGGAGNYGWDYLLADEDQEYKKATEERKQEQLRASVEEGVNDTLAMPQKAKLAGNEPLQM